MNDALKSLEAQLTNVEESLRLIAERKSEYIEATSIPLDLVKNEQRLMAERERLLAEVAKLSLAAPDSAGTVTASSLAHDAGEERRQQLAIQRRNLNELELQRARYGIRVPLDLVNEIGLVQERIGELEEEIAQLGSAELGQGAA